MNILRPTNSLIENIYAIDHIDNEAFLHYLEKVWKWEK